MKKSSPLLLVLSVVLCLAMVIPTDVLAQATTPANQRAGQVSRVVPQVRIVRGTQQMNGVASAPVNFGDLINTQKEGRARIALDDGSVINVGSQASVKITLYNPGQQQTQMDLAYGQLRSKVAKITQPNGKFEVHTPVGVAGVVGTDFYISYMNNMMSLIVFEGSVRFCNLQGACVVAAGGAMSIIRGNNQPPDMPSPVTPAMLAEAGADTETVAGGVAPAGTAAAPPLSLAAQLGLIALVIVPGIVIPIAVPHSSAPPAVPCNPAAGFAAGCPK